MRAGQPAATQAAFHAFPNVRIGFGCLSPPRPLALNSLDAVDARARSIREAIASLPRTRNDVPSRNASYVPSLLDKILADLEDE